MAKRKKREKLKPETIKKAKSFLTFLKPYWKTYAVGFAFLFASSIVSIAIPYLLAKILGMDPKNSSDDWTWFDYHSLYGVLSIIAIALPIQAVLSFFRVYLFSVVTLNTLTDIRKLAFSALIKSPLSFFDQNKTGELSSRIATDVNLISETLTTTIAEFLRQIITILFALGLVIYTSPALALTMVTVIPIVALLAVFFGKFIKKLSKETQDESAYSNGILEEALIGIKSLKAYTNELFEITRYSKSVTKIRSIALKAAIWRGLFIGFILIIMFGAIVFIIWRGIELVKLGEVNGGISSESFFQFIMMTVMLGVSVGAVPDLMAKIQSSFGATENLIDILNAKQENDSEVEASSAVSLNGDISFKNVNFSYPSRENHLVLDDVNFEVKKGQQIAIVGMSGGGKSTIANLILQFYTPQKGEISFDGKLASEYHITDVRRNMAYVPQEIILLSGTIYDNILYGNPSASEQEIHAAAKKANALEFIQSFPDTFNTVVGDRGIQLSGGQRQRIAIARAILRNPSILILDEATSALDQESESLVQTALNELMIGRTSIVIAHRLSTIQNADNVIVVRDGKIVESGSPSELAKLENSYFQKLNSLNSNN